jgi:arginyl-tRNA synthetase
MTDPLRIARDALAPAFAAVAGHAVDPVVRPSDRADAQANGALALAKSLGRSPREVAEAVLGALDGTMDDVAALEVAGPGFLNITFSADFLARQLMAVAADDRLGIPVATTPETVVLDYSHPNVAKEMHVGHLRTTIIGDALARMLLFAGHTIIRENHIGDWGTPFGMLIEHLLDLGEDEAANELSVGDLDGFYRAARRAFDADPAFQERARARVVALQSGDAETLRLWHVLVDESTRYFDAVYDRLGVLLEPDDLMGESAYNDLLPEVVRRLDAADLLTISDGAAVVFPAGFTNRRGEPLPLIVRKSDGGYGYAATDLATVIDRVERLGATLLLYVVGAPQAQHLQMVWAVAEEAGWLRPPARAVHVPFGNVLGPDRKMLKSRSGASVKLVDLLDEAVQRAEAAIVEKNPELPADERSAVARIVGIGAVKYADLSTDRIKDYVFDWERMLSFDGDTAPYLQYAHARICSIFRRAGIERTTVRQVLPVLGEPEERGLALRLLGYDAAVADALERYSPHRLTAYLFDLALDFTAFYEACPVLRAPDEATRDSRLALADLTARVLAHGLGLLGIDVPERM